MEVYSYSTKFIFYFHFHFVVNFDLILGEFLVGNPERIANSKSDFVWSVGVAVCVTLNLYYAARIANYSPVLAKLSPSPSLS